LFKGSLSFEHPAIHAKETSLYCSRNATLEDFQFVLHVLENGGINCNQYITLETSFESILTDFDDWASLSSKEIKIVAAL
jgi:threonine dehydrogenase-like Zn-dependent dehydrogenase